MNASIFLGTSGDDGDLGAEDTAGTAAVSLDGDTGDVTNSLPGNGLVKAWARIDADGTVIDCWRCNKNTAETGRLSKGNYEVDFTPPAPDIQSRPSLLVVANHDPFAAGVSIECVPICAGSPADTSSLRIQTYRVAPLELIDCPFTVSIY